MAWRMLNNKRFIVITSVFYTFRNAQPTITSFYDLVPSCTPASKRQYNASCMVEGLKE